MSVIVSKQNANSSDVEVLKKIISSINNDEDDVLNIASKLYTWGNGRLTGIDWNEKGLSGDISFKGLDQLD
ncbi:MAG: hypothetical protein K5656_09385 [Lachnospiraceae bacterium]|nr:hypothetical protein [Lachnospiraceae bacterium]